MTAERTYSPEDIEAMGENVDVLVSLDIGGKEVYKTFISACQREIRKPLCLLAAEKLKERVGHGDFVLISSGMLIYPYETLAETDGPLGAASLARALQVGLGAKPVIVTDRAAVGMTQATCRGASLNVTDIGTVKKTERTVSVIGFPMDEKEAKREADRLWQELAPKAIIAIERRGRNEKGVYHALPKGRNMNATEAKMVTLYDKAKGSGALTIGIGDGGNEIGWGIIGDVIKEKMPFGDRCSCGCGGGIGDSTLVDVMVAASVSNWGAYGVAACLSVLMNNPEILHDAKIESRMLRECIDAGGIDGVSYFPEPKVDGLPEEAQIAIVTLLHEITKSGFVYPDYIYK